LLRLTLPVTAGLAFCFLIGLGVPLGLVLAHGAGETLRAWPLTLITCAVMVASSTVLGILLRRGYVRVASTGLAVLLWLLVTFWLYISTGINDASVGAYFVVALLLGMVWGVPGAVVAALATALAVSGAYAVEALGYLVIDPEPIDVFNLVVALIVLGLGFVMIVAVVQTVEDALDRARARAGALDESYRALAARSEELAARSEELAAQNAELDAFAHTVAHDLKNPLSALITMNAMLVRGDERFSRSQRARYTALMDQGLRTMARIVDSLLLLARVRSEADVVIEPLAMAPLVTHALTRLAAVTPPDARIVTPETWPAALGYAPWVEEIWVNYLSNAFKYGGAPARIELGADLLSGEACRRYGLPPTAHGCVRYWVQDHGPGIPQEDQARLFMPFERLHGVSIEGEGLGLSIVRRIAERLNGAVGVESAPGQGSRFTFVLPAAPRSSVI
jgi:signal transduction histidine kinase